MNEQLAEDTKLVLEALPEHKWIQNAWSTINGECVCLSAAVHQTLYKDLHFDQGLVVSGDEEIDWTRAINVLALYREVIVDKFGLPKSVLIDSDTAVVVSFNDSPERDFEDIHFVMVEAHRRASE